VDLHGCRLDVFVPARQFAGVNVSSVRVPIAQNATLIARSRRMTRFAVLGGVLSAGGPPVSQIERVAGKRIPRVSLAAAKADPVPIRTSLQRGRAPVVVPASDRAKLIGTRERHAPQIVSRTKLGTVTSDRAVRSLPPPPQHERHERATIHQPLPSPSSPRHERTGTQAQLNSPPSPAQVERQPNVQPKPQGPPPPAHANPPGKEKEKEHGKEN
jgi:hypothetical protein